MLKSFSPELRWPAVIDPKATTVFAFFSQLMRTQWLDAATIRQLQAAQLANRLNHAAKTSAHFRPLRGATPIAPKDSFAVLRTLPPLTRGDLQEKSAELFCEVDKAHGKTNDKRTTGSTGQPVTVRCTDAAFALREALTLRSYAWFGVAQEKSFAAIRSGIALGKTQGAGMRTWGGTLGRLFETGPSFGLSLTTPVPQQLAWLRQHKPGYLLSYPSNLQVLLEAMPEPWEGLVGVMSIGETVSEALRADLKARWGVSLFDQYSSEELGSIAVQCPHGSYHTMAESLHVEVLRDDGTACQPGEIGRVVVTDLYNFATAMLRYELRDCAEVGPACPCGRKLPPLKRIVGRSRNRLTLPDGTKIWPNTGLRDFDTVPIRQYQLVQLSTDKLELHLHVARSLGADELKVVEHHVLKSIGHPFRLDIRAGVVPLPKGSNGKFEQFVSLVA